MSSDPKPGDERFYDTIVFEVVKDSSKPKPPSTKKPVEKRWLRGRGRYEKRHVRPQGGSS